MTYLLPKTWVTRQEDYMRLDKVPASYDPGPWEPDYGDSEDVIGEIAGGRADADMQDSEVIQDVFSEGVRFTPALAELAVIANRLPRGPHEDRALALLGSLLLDEMRASFVKRHEAEIRA